MSLIIGIDPGVSGGIVSLNPNGSLESSQIGISQDSLYEFFISKALFKPIIIVEDVNCNAALSKLSSFSFGRGVGHIEMLAKCFQLPLHRVTPSEWKRYHGISKKAKGETPKEVKAKSIKLAKRLRPDLPTTMPKGKKDMDGVCEAYLIAEYGRVFLRLGESQAEEFKFDE